MLPRPRGLKTLRKLSELLIRTGNWVDSLHYKDDQTIELADREAGAMYTCAPARPKTISIIETG